ncbi:MAG: response regulator [Bacteroidetes bacterium]|jgi:CheY-like chemotaxis protein|nr:response regulator [Bacteroidota bacterium]
MKYKILAADDSNICLKVIKEIFNLVGDNYELIFAHDGKEAVEKAIEQLPDLILMDIIMPEMNGVRAIKELRNNRITGDIPIIVLSATESLESAFEAGANDFITKPFKHYELLMRARQALSMVEKINTIKSQRDLIAQQKKDIIDDIRYSKRIQSAILPTHEKIKNHIKDYFLLDLPKNIVSGDFYWVGSKGGKTVIAVADCTGHGISGAFMTMAGTAYLNEIVNKYEFEHASDILFHLRNHVINLLQQKGEEGETTDGMDIALLLIDEASGQVQYAGANNPVYLVKNNEIAEYKADRMPIGIHIHFNKPFTDQVLDISPGDILYMFTDGYADQFGGPQGKKFRYKNFRELLINIHQKPFADQQQILDQTMKVWKGKEEQVDDILVMGIKF